MYCYKCAAELPDDAVFCLKCGAKMPAANEKEVQEPSSPTKDDTPKKGMRTGAKVWLWIGIALSALVTISAVRNVNRTNDLPTTSMEEPKNSIESVIGRQETSEAKPQEKNNQTKVEAEEKYKPIVVDLTLGGGHYVVGVDIPAGVYDITAVSGGGNVNSTNSFRGGINAIMGVAEKNSDGSDLYQQTYKNISLPDGETLTISRVVVNLHCSEASGAPLQPRNQVGLKEVELGNGHFVAGKDFPAGVYDIVAVSGRGNVSSDNAYDGGLNEIMGVAEKDDDDWCVQEYLHVLLEEGVTINISRVSIKLIPSK
jgi:hypothetical protein